MGRRLPLFFNRKSRRAGVVTSERGISNAFDDIETSLVVLNDKCFPLDCIHSRRRAPALKPIISLPIPSPRFDSPIPNHLLAARPLRSAPAARLPTAMLARLASAPGGSGIMLDLRALSPALAAAAAAGPTTTLAPAFSLFS